MKWAVTAVMLGFCCAAGVTTAQQLPPCSERSTVLLKPWTDISRWCIEGVINDDSAGELSFTALAVAPDGTLYAARPLAGQVLALTDTDGDLLPDTPHVIASGLTLPNGLAYSGGALYISGGPHIYRLADGELETLVDDLPSGGGFWTGGLAVGPDNRIYVATGAPCDFCEPDDDARGAVLSFALDGSNRQLVASGLRQPSGVAWHLGQLWTVDTAPDNFGSVPDLDELDLVSPGAHFGWPYCLGKDNQPDSLTGSFDCAGATPPALSFPTHSTSLGLASYTSPTIPALTGALLITLGGENSDIYLPGYRLIAVYFDEDGSPVNYQDIVPWQNAYSAVTWQNLNYGGLGFWPHRPISVAVSPEGWVYISTGGGRIFALRQP